MEQAERDEHNRHPTEPDISDALGKLWRLKTEGALNQKEYDAAKSRLLGM
jgi:hypothetical protein